MQSALRGTVARVFFSIDLHSEAEQRDNGALATRDGRVRVKHLRYADKNIHAGLAVIGSEDLLEGRMHLLDDFFAAKTLET